MRLIDLFRNVGLFVGSVVVTQYDGQRAADVFRDTLKSLGIKVFTHYLIPGYPSDVPLIVSQDGYGKNEFVETERKIVVVTAPGPGSGKMAVCLSQLYHEHLRGVEAGYAKFETFPIWNLSINHPVNLAYEAATADLNDMNMIDPFHLDAYGKVTVNYNRDVEIFPVLQAIFTKIYGFSHYKSPTDMGVNMVGNCISDDEAVCQAAKQEIIRRYYNCLCDVRFDTAQSKEKDKILLLMNKAGVTTKDRTVARVANEVAEKTGEPAAAIELSDGTVITGKTKELLGAASAAVLNAIKHLAGLDDELLLLPEYLIEPVQGLKVDYLGSKNPRLHVDEVLVALSVSAATNEKARKALTCLPLLRGCQAHISVIPSSVDSIMFRKLGLQMTCEPEYEKANLFHIGR